MDYNSEEIKQETKTVVDHVTLVDDRTDKEITLENSTTFDKDGKIVEYDSKEVTEDEEAGIDILEPEELPVVGVVGNGAPLISSVEKFNPSMEEALTDLGESLSEEEEDIEITADDIKNTINTSEFSIGNGFNISDEDTLKLLEIVNKVKAKESINIYSNLPDSVKGMINKYMIDQGVQGYSVQANSIRNMLASSLIDEFISNISINKSLDSFNKEMEDLFAKTGEEFSKMYKEYDSERTKYLEAALEKIPEGDPKRETVTKVLDSINDAYKLTRLKEATGKLKIKNFEREKPEKVFSDFEFKYKDQQYNIYKFDQVLGVLYKHLTTKIAETFPEDMPEEEKISKAGTIAGIESVDFLILFCKFCMNYKVQNPEEHAFMYYTLYNIMLLDIYKGEEYEDFATGFINNIIESYKPYYKKTMTEENFKRRFG